MKNCIEEDYSNIFIDHYTKLIEWNNNYSKYYHIIGCAHYKQGNLNEAEKYFTRAIELDDTQPLYYHNRAIIYYKLGQYDKAVWDYTDSDDVKEYTCKNEYTQGLIDDYTALISLNSDELDYYYIRGNLYYKQNDYKKAIKDYTVIIKSGVKYSKLCYVHYMRGLCYYNFIYVDIKSDFEKALELLDQNTVEYTLRGSLYFRAREYEKALDDLTQALYINPKDVNAYRYRGKTYYKQGKNQEAINDLNKAIQYDSQYADDYYYRGLCYYKIDKLDQAIDDYTTAIELQDDWHQYYQDRGNAYSKLNRHEEAIADFTQIIDNKLLCVKYCKEEDIVDDDEHVTNTNWLYEKKNNSHFAACYCNMALEKLKLGMKNQAMQDYTRAIELDGYLSTPYFGRGIVYEEQNKYEKAIEYYTVALRLEIADTKKRSNELIISIVKSRAFIYEQLKQYENATKDYSKLIEQKSDNESYYLSRAKNYIKLKDYDKAIYDYTYVISINTKCAEAYIGRADAYREIGNMDAAINDYERANILESSPNKRNLKIVK